ncbi:MAG: EamA family transporter, partial [Planctomycetia bacterium]|nr:EamA family transporter [Planctomycetia bacterium]
MESHIDGGTLVLGVAAGLVAAFLSAFSYFVSRDHGSRGGSSLRLLVLAHALMGAACIPASWLLWPSGLQADARWLVPLVASTVFYLLGQVVVFTALKLSQASRVAPLLGLKIAMLAGITCF